MRVEHAERLLTPRQVYAVPGVTEPVVYRLIDERRLLATRTPGGHRRFRAADVERLRIELGGPAIEPPPGPVRLMPGYGRRRRWLSAAQVAALVDVDARTVRRWADDGILPATACCGGPVRPSASAATGEAMLNRCA